MTDEIAERGRKIGGTTLRSISDISRHQLLKDNNEEFLTAHEMLSELCADKSTADSASSLQACALRAPCDVGTTSFIETWIDETERRQWFLSEIVNEP